MIEHLVLLDQIPIGLFVLEDDYRVVFWNSCLEEWTGIPRERILGTDVRHIAPGLHKPLFASRLKGIFAGGPPVVFSSQLHKYIIPIPTRDGKLRIQHTVVTAIPKIETAGFDALFAIQDVTELTYRLEEYKAMRDQAIQEAQNRERAQEAEHYQRILAEALRDATAALNSTLDLDGVLDRILENVGRVISYKLVDIMLVEAGRARIVRSHQKIDIPHLTIGHEFTIADTPNLREMAYTGQPIMVPDTRQYPGWVDIPATRWIRSYVGAPILIRERLAGFLNLSSNEPNYFSELIIEPLKMFANQAALAIQNARLYAAVEQSAVTDELTGLYNRRGLRELGTREIARAQRFDHPLTAILFDIDHFKHVNDQFGHPSGDLVLRALAECLRDHIRTVDIAARYGGEEFVVLLPETDLTTSRKIAERLRLAIAQTRVSLDHHTTTTVTVSIGVATFQPGMTDLDQLLLRADQAQYIAKKTGRNRVAVFAET